MEELYNLKLHESFTPKEGTAVSIQRVPNGWNYIYYNGGCVFVPYHKEFEPKKEKTQTTRAKPIEERKKDFTEDVRLYLDRYDKDILNEFVSYWTEPNKTKKKMKFEMQTTWDTSRRLATWANRNKEFDKNKPNEESTTISWPSTTSR